MFTFDMISINNDMNKKPFGIIYKATNLINSKCYVGKTTKTLDKRKWQHKNDAEKYRYNSTFHKAIRKYGIDNFKWEVLCECENKDLLDIRETMKIIIEHSYVSEDKGYNMTWGGDGRSGYKHTQQSIQKMSNSHKNMSDETKRKIQEARTGEICSEETKEKMRISHGITDDILDKMKFLINEGLTAYRISKILGITHKTIYKYIKINS